MALYLNILTNGTADNHLALEGADAGFFLCGKKIRKNASLMVFTVNPAGFAQGVLRQCTECVTAVQS